MALRAEAARRPAPAPSRPQLRVVPGKGRRWPALPLVILLIVAAFGVTAMQASVGERGLQSAVLERQVQQETERLTLLRARVAQLASSQRIAEEAAELGMVPMSNPQHLAAPMPSASPAPSRFDPEAVKRLTSPTP